MKIVIFDMDGTLIDSKKDLAISINYIRKTNHNLDALSEEFVVECINMEVRDLPSLFYGTKSYEQKDRDMFEEHYAKQCIQNPYLYDGVRETLMSLVSAGVKISVATNAPTQFAVRMLTQLGVEDMFDVIIGADKVKASKPDPEMLQVILKHYHYDRTQDKAWMVGDNSKDMLSASNARIEAIFATWGFSPQSEHLVSIADPKEIISIVGI